MLNLDNHTHWPASIFPNPLGEPSYTALLKLSFTYQVASTQAENTPTGIPFYAIEPLAEPEAIAAADKYFEPEDDQAIAKQPLELAGEHIPPKPKSDLLLQGTAYPVMDAQGNPAEVTKVGIRLERLHDPDLTGQDLHEKDLHKQDWMKVLRVYGERYWQASSNKKNKSKKASQAAPTYRLVDSALTQPLPIDYRDSAGSLPNEQGFSTNPSGHPPLPLANDDNETAESYPEQFPAPRFEIIEQPLSDPYAAIPPAGFGPIAPFWLPRVNELLKIDQADTDSDAESKQADQNPIKSSAKARNLAPIDQQFDQPFTGGETITLAGLAAATHHRTTLQQWRVPAVTITANLVNEAGERHAVHFACDTLSINSDAQTFNLQFRSAIALAPDDPAVHWLEILNVDIQAMQPVSDNKIER